MKEILAGIFIIFIFLIVISPYFSLWDLKDLGGIRQELIGIKKELERINEGIREWNRLD